MKTHRGEQEIFPAEQIGVRHEEDQKAKPGEQHERHRDQIDQKRQQAGLHALDRGARQRDRHAGRIGRIVHMLDFGRNLVGEEARNERRDRRHEEDRAGDQPKARQDGEHP